MYIAVYQTGFYQAEVKCKYELETLSVILGELNKSFPMGQVDRR